MGTQFIQPGYDASEMVGTPHLEANRSTDAWLCDLTGRGKSQADAIADLRRLLRRAVLYALSRTSALRNPPMLAQAEQIVEECTQESLLATLDGLPAFPVGCKFTTWTYKFAVKSTLAAARREGWKLK
jgi:RNA polymerase sigma-70 factor (ECF subfamily)